MRYTEEKAKQLESMMRSFARKHGLNINIEHDENVRDHVYSSTIHVYIPYGKSRYCVFEWDRCESLSEGAAYIFADIINDFNIKPMSHKTDGFVEYARRDVETTLNAYINMTAANGPTVPKIQDVIFNNPATIIKWADGTKTVVKAQGDDEYDPEKGLAMAIAKKVLGNKGNYNNEINKWLTKYDPPIIYPQVSFYHHESFRDILEKRLTELGFPVKRDVISDVNKSIEENKL